MLSKQTKALYKREKNKEEATPYSAHTYARPFSHRGRKKFEKKDSKYTYKCTSSYTMVARKNEMYLSYTFQPCLVHLTGSLTQLLCVCCRIKKKNVFRLHHFILNMHTFTVHIYYIKLHNNILIDRIYSTIKIYGEMKTTE